ncbi:hypothetical protein L195_g026076, partial [Trifolium pratense]
MTRNNLINSWQDFLLTLETRFAHSFYDDPRGALFKLTQTGSVNQYLNEFERISNKVLEETQQKFKAIEDRLSMMEGGGDPIDLANMCLVPDLVLPPKFKVPDFEKYK